MEAGSYCKFRTVMVCDVSWLIGAVYSQFDEIVFARTSPQQKFQIVKTFQASGCTVAVTGDGGELLLSMLRNRMHTDYDIS